MGLLLPQEKHPSNGFMLKPSDLPSDFEVGSHTSARLPIEGRQTVNISVSVAPLARGTHRLVYLSKIDSWESGVLWVSGSDLFHGRF